MVYVSQVSYHPYDKMHGVCRVSFVGFFARGGFATILSTFLDFLVWESNTTGHGIVWRAIGKLYV
jgi:hypothetical protein